MKFSEKMRLQYHILTDDGIREDVTTMCNLSQGILEKGEARGEARGRAVERIESIRILIADNIEEGVPGEKTIAKLQKHYHLSENEAKQYYEKFS